MEQHVADFLNSDAGLELLTKLIQDKLQVNVELDEGTNYYNKGVRVVVTTSFNGMEVCQSSDEFTF